MSTKLFGLNSKIEVGGEWRVAAERSVVQVSSLVSQGTWFCHTGMIFQELTVPPQGLLWSGKGAWEQLSLEPVASQNSYERVIICSEETDAPRETYLELRSEERVCYTGNDHSCYWQVETYTSVRKYLPITLSRAGWLYPKHQEKRERVNNCFSMRSHRFLPWVLKITLWIPSKFKEYLINHVI